MNVVVQLLSGAWVFVTPRTVALKVSLSSTISWSLFEFLSFESLMSTNHLILCCALLLLPLIFPLIRVFSNESTLHIRRSKYLRFSISLSSGYSGLIFLKFSSVAQSHPTLCDTMDCSMPGFSVHHQPSELAQCMSIKWWCYPTISSSVVPFSCLQSLSLSFQWVFRTDFLCDWLVWSPCSRRDSQEFSQTPQLKSVNTEVLGFLYGLSVTSIHDYWKNHSFDYMDLCWQSNVSAF